MFESCLPYLFLYIKIFTKKIIIKIEKIIERTKRVSKYIRLNIIENHNFYNKIIFQNWLNIKVLKFSLLFKILN